MHMLQTHLLNRYTGNRQVVLFVEEAQGMPLETLEEIRLLSNLETDQDKLLQIILFGQPELDENLKTSSIRQLKERVTHEFNLSPLTEAEIHQYLNFRMREVGYTGPELIDERVAKVVTKYSGGLLRRINIIADKVLLSAFAENTHDITVKHVNAAVQDSGFERSIDGRLTSDNKAVYFVLLIFVLIFVWLLISGKGNSLLKEVASNFEQKETILKKNDFSASTKVAALKAPEKDKLEINTLKEVKPAIKEGLASQIEVVKESLLEEEVSKKVLVIEPELQITNPEKP